MALHAESREGERLDPVSLQHVRVLLGVVLRTSRAWTAAMLVAALLSALSITVAPDGDVSGGFEPKTLTGILLALIWLPPLLRVIALAGGGLKTPAGEATTGGLIGVLAALEPNTKRDTLPALIAALSSPEVFTDAERRVTTRPIRRELELQLAAVTPRTVGVREQLSQLAAEYERIRREEPPSDERTRRMTTLTAEGRAAARATALAPIDVGDMLVNGGEGERVIALALLQDAPDPRLFEHVIGAIVESRSAFEQYHALGAAFEMLPFLDGEQRRHLKRVLKTSMQDSRRAIAADASRARLVEALLRDLES